MLPATDWRAFLWVHAPVGSPFRSLHDEAGQGMDSPQRGGADAGRVERHSARPPRRRRPGGTPVLRYPHPPHPPLADRPTIGPLDQRPEAWGGMAHPSPRLARMSGHPPDASHPSQASPWPPASSPTSHCPDSGQPTTPSGGPGLGRSGPAGTSRARTPMLGGGEDTLPPGEPVCDLAGLSYTGNPLEPSEISYYIVGARGTASVTAVTAYCPLGTGNSAEPGFHL